jgi:hypothetical protein
MYTANILGTVMRSHQRRFGAVAGPLSLVLLPKCPLCFASILAGVGVVVPGALGLSVAAAVLVAAWVVVLFLIARGQTRLRAAVAFAAAVSFVAIVMQIRPLLWSGVAVMMAAGIVATRSCAAKRSGVCGVIAVTTPSQHLDIDPSRGA